jgi:hypothetical protein
MDDARKTLYDALGIDPERMSFQEFDGHVDRFAATLTDTIRIPRFDPAVCSVTLSIAGKGNPQVIDHWAPESGTS